ncbi:unnamed protein product [Durusdinium trenchii]|uniref:Uncharacterized protein n=1 Tax=Durusdinium trenchii TaxID=1381693 RepID=A0ABP0P8L1_9DINO
MAAVASPDASSASTNATAQAPALNLHGYHQMPMQEFMRLANGKDSYDRSMARRAAMDREQKRQVAAIGESRSLWYALRRHGTKQQCEEWLDTIHSHSTWLRDREGENEVLRKQYHVLWDAVRAFDPSFVDTEMRGRQERQAASARPAET